MPSCVLKELKKLAGDKGLLFGVNYSYTGNVMVKEARELVRLMTKDPQPKDKEAAKKAYYTALMEHPKAALVKCFDRVNNLSNMALGFTRDHMAEYVEETEKYVVPLIRALKNNAPEYTDPCWLLSYQMYSLLETYKRLL